MTPRGLSVSAKSRALARGLERSGYPTKPPGYAEGFAVASRRVKPDEET